MKRGAALFVLVGSVELIYWRVMGGTAARQQANKETSEPTKTNEAEEKKWNGAAAEREGKSAMNGIILIME